MKKVGFIRLFHFPLISGCQSKKGMRPNCRGLLSDTVALADLFASASDTSSQSIAVGHTPQNVAISGLIAGNQELIWLSKEPTQLEK